MESTRPLIKFSCAHFQLILPPLSLATFWLPSLWTSKKENCSAFTYLCLLSFTQHVFGSIQGVLKTYNNKNKNMGMSLFWFLQVPLLFLTLFLHYAPSVLFPVDAVLCSHTLLHSIPYSSLLIAKKIFHFMVCNCSKSRFKYESSVAACSWNVEALSTGL